MIDSYLGPKVQVQPNELSRFENGKWAAEEKIDGFWCEVSTNNAGVIVSIKGRSGKTFSNANVYGLLGHNLGLPNSIFAAELEAGTEAANIKHDKIGYRRLWAFDLIQLFGKKTTTLSYEKRRELLELAVSKTNSQVFKITKRVTEGFENFYKTVMSNNGEGLVLKRLGTPYNPYNSSGKTEDWVRCKAFRYVDYIVLEIGKSKGGSDNFQVGLIVEGKLMRVATIKNLPKWMKEPSDYVGRIIECKGMEVHDSGALRHGHFERIREDKSYEECTIEAARRS